MKKLLLPLLILLAFSASAQPFVKETTGVNGGYDWLRGVFRAQIAPTYADTSNYPNWVPRRAGHFMLDTAGSDAGTWYVKYGGYWHPIFGGGGGDTDTSSTYLKGGNGIALSQIVDTVVMAVDFANTLTDSSNYKIFGTGQIKRLAGLLAPYFRRSGDSLYLAGYVNSPNSVYGQIASGVPTMIRAAIIDTTNRTAADTTYPVYVSAQGKHVYVPKPAGYTPPSMVQFIVGITPVAPANGDSILAQTAFIGKFPTLFRDGLEQYYNSTLPGSYQYSSGTLTAHPPFYTGEKVKIYLTNARPDTVGIEASWTFTTIGTNNNVSNVSNVYTSTVTGFNWNASYALMAQTFVGDRAVRMQHKADASSYLLGLRDDNVNSDYPSYDIGFYISNTAGNLSYVQAGTPTSLGISLNPDDYVSIKRTGSTFVLQTSTNGLTWTTVHTFSYTSSATHYINLNLYSNFPYGKAYNIAIR